MKLTVLGSGSSVPQARRSSSGFWLETTAGTILLDCSASVVHRMAAENLDWANLDAIWLSHFHLDHAGGLAPLLFATKHAPATRERRKPLKICGPKGLQKLLEAFDAANNYRLFAQPFPLEIVEVEPRERFEILPGAEAATLKTPHTDESLAIYLRDRDEKTLVFTADTGPDEALSVLARGVDLFLTECSFVRDKPVEKHLELAEAMFLTMRARPRRAMLTHFYPEWDAVDFAAEVAGFAPPCEILEARDGLRVEI